MVNRNTAEMEKRPDDFQARYEWQEGSLPPPFHYEYTIEVRSDGEGLIEMIPDYPGEDVQVWSEPFTVEQGELDELYRLMFEKRAFEQAWRAQDEPPVGGSGEWLTATAHGRTIEIPAYVVESQEPAAEEIYAAIRALVPQAIWDRLHAQREQYMEEHRDA